MRKVLLALTPPPKTDLPRIGRERERGQNCKFLAGYILLESPRPHFFRYRSVGLFRSVPRVLFVTFFSRFELSLVYVGKRGACG